MKNIVDLAEKSITLKRNDLLQMKGDLNTNIYYVVKGTLRVFVLDKEEEHNIRFGYKGSLFVSLDSYLTGQPSEFYIQAIKQTELKVISKSQMEDWLIHTDHKQWWIDRLQSLIVQQLEREIDILTTSPKERYLRVLKRSPQLFQEIPHRHIANYLRMSAETLSRLKNS